MRVDCTARYEESIISPYGFLCQNNRHMAGNIGEGNVVKQGAVAHVSEGAKVLAVVVLKRGVKLLLFGGKQR
ncbi:hypothetical protein ACET3Z_010498 [Daucus carota]